MRTKRLIERVDGHMARGNELMTRLDKRLASLDEELRLSRESRERMVDDFRALAHEIQARFERLVRGFEAQIDKNNDALDSTLDAVNSQSAAIQHVLARLPPLPDEG